jgi:hypothetical protein
MEYVSMKRKFYKDPVERKVKSYRKLYECYFIKKMKRMDK